MNKRLIINPCKMEIYSGSKKYPVFCQIELQQQEGKKILYIHGVVGPKNSGNCYGSCGQILDEFEDAEKVFNKGWNQVKLDKFIELWRKWHLNDLHAECIHQEARGENWDNAPSAVCPQCGWKLGHGWDYREVPKDVITWLFNLPETEIKPAWV
jgi:hypothetical protein